MSFFGVFNVGRVNPHIIRKSLVAVEEKRGSPLKEHPDDAERFSANDGCFYNIADWLLDVGSDPYNNGSYCFRRATSFRAIEICFQYFRRAPCITQKIQLCGIAALVIASKLEEHYPMSMVQASDMTDKLYEPNEIQLAEGQILKELKFDVSFPTAHQLLLATLADLSLVTPLVETLAELSLLTPKKKRGKQLKEKRGEELRQHCEMYLFLGVGVSSLYDSFPASMFADVALVLGTKAAGEWSSEVENMTTHPRREWAPLAKEVLLTDQKIKLPEGRTYFWTQSNWRSIVESESHKLLISEFMSEESLGKMWPIICPTTHVTERSVWEEYEDTSPINYNLDTDHVNTSYGKIHKAKNKNNGEIVAIKEAIRVEGSDEEDVDGVNADMIIEVSILKLLPPHPNIIMLKDVFLTDKTVYAVYEYMETDLRQYLDRNPISPRDAAVVFKQVVQGVAHVHSYGRMHRDLKPENILVETRSAGGPKVKVADFGLGEVAPLYPGFDSLSATTLWYVSPEHLLGSKDCYTAMDVWALGCILVELLTGSPMFATDANTKFDMIINITQVFGKLTEDNWPGVSKFPHWNTEFPKFEPQPLDEYLKQQNIIDEQAIHCVGLMLKLNPDERITSQELLSHPYLARVNVPHGEPGVVVGGRHASVVKDTLARLHQRRTAFEPDSSS